MDTFQAQLERLIDVRRYAEARQLLESSFAATPADPKAHFYAARIAVGENDRERAQEHLQATLAADPGHVGARFLRFALLLDEKRYPEAEEIIRELIREDPDDADFLAWYARLMLYTLHLDKARALVAEALRREPDNQQARLQAVLLALIDGDPSLAQQELADLVSADPTSWKVATTLILVLVEAHRFGDALEIAQQLLRVAPDNQDVLDLVIELRVQTHWISWPAYPVKRWGWAGSAAMWAVFIVGLFVLRRVAPALALVFAGVYLLYVIYSWTYEPLLTRWLRWRGIG